MKKAMALIMGLMFVALSASPAAAAVTQGYTTDGGVIDTRITTTWRTQADGSGVYVEDIHLTTPNGCSSGEASGNDIYSMTEFSLRNPNTDALIAYKADASYSGDGWDCTTTWDVEWAGKDQGGTDFTARVKVRVNNSPDYLIYLRYTMFIGDPPFNMDLVYQSIVPCSETTAC